MTHPPAPDLFDSKYLLVGDIREGGMSTVQMAYEPTTKRKCAIKRMLTDRKEWPHWKESFYREAKALSDLSEHENIVDLYGSGSDDQGCHYLVLEWLPQTLQAFIEKNGPLNWDDFYAKFGRPILRGLVYAQSRNWTHRDIKPSNILLSEHNLPKITDFGIARQLGTPDLGLTLRHFLSVRFSPPEDDLLYRYSRDCFSWAAVALYCLTANLPRTYPELAALLDAVDPDMAPLRILESCLSLTPSERPPLASALLAQLETGERTRLARTGSAPTYSLRLSTPCLGSLQKALGQSDKKAIEAAILRELNEVRAGFRSLDRPDCTTGVQVFGQTWAFEMTRDPEDAESLLIEEAELLSATRAEHHRRSAFRSDLAFTFDAPPSHAVKSSALDTLYSDIEQFEKSVAGLSQDLRPEHIIQDWYSFLSAKADFDRNRQISIEYSGLVHDADEVIVRTRRQYGASLVGKSWVLRVRGKASISGEIVDPSAGRELEQGELALKIHESDQKLMPKAGRPGAITASELPTGFSAVGNDAWLSVIGFGEDQRQRSEQHKARRLAAESIGLPAELADQLQLLPPDTLKTLGAELLQRIASGAYAPPQFPERTSANPERRAARLAARAQTAPTKSYETRSRSVRTSDKDARQLARPYLRDLYTNESGEMICQACHLAMPFRLDDGAHYFEAPELLQSVSAEVAENHLALCPTCCAKWQNANSTSDAELHIAIVSGEGLEVRVTLAGEAGRLRFVQVHIEDLRTIFGAFAENTS